MGIPTWRARCQQCIQEAFLQWADVNGKMPNPADPEAERMRFLKMLSKFYPFGERKHFPYKVWCEETRKVKMWLLRIPAPRQEVSEFQGELF